MLKFGVKAEGSSVFIKFIRYVRKLKMAWAVLSSVTGMMGAPSLMKMKVTSEMTSDLTH